MSKVSKSFFWSAIDYSSVQIIQLIITVIIARLVSPSAFGVVVIVQVFMAFARLFIDGGFKIALIQKKNRSDVDYYTIFLFNLVIAILLYSVMFIAAPYIADLYNEPILTELTRVIALNLIFSSLSITQLVRLQVNLDFKTQAKARVISLLLSGGIAIICAYNGMEVWALVVQSVLATLCTSLFLMVYSKWMPRLIFSINSFKQLFAFGMKILFSNFLTTFYIQITNLVIGKFYTSADLAYYNRGFSLGSLPSVSIMDVISRTVYPIYCQLQDDREALLMTYRKYLRIACLIIFPIMILTCVLSRPLILAVLTERWVATAPLLSIFCVVFITYPFIETNGKIILAVGRAGLVAKTSILKRGIAFIILIVTILISVEAVAIGLAVSNIIEMIITMQCVKIAIAISIKQQIKHVSDILLASILAGGLACCVYLCLDNIYLQLSVGTILGISMFVACVFLFKMEELKYISFLFQKIKSVVK